MPKSSLNKSLKDQDSLQTDIGDFTYARSLGEGGNSFVFLFEKEGMSFAIKFLKPCEQDKIKRFKDEYFCAMQIPSHRNIAQAYHFDSVRIIVDPIIKTEKYNL